ncbi:substrate-binding periplasmic protein [Maridesulfovibrio sp. FT414]|uniref:substrate-binding periplasmic protein n=1 Tax=Maridesulfovibrio sp. FT414 TaxID=2979469 RepID=UPI003D80513E
MATSATAATIRIPYFAITILLTLSIFPTSTMAADILVGGTGYWTPYCYTTPDAPDTLKGFTVDILKQIFQDSNDQVKFMVLPWKRCLKMLDHSQLDLVLDGSRDSKRLQKYMFSDEVYQLDNVFFYLTKNYPNGLMLQDSSEIGKYTLGGITSLNYSMYPFPESSVQHRAANMKGMVAMLRYDRFELGIAFKQILFSNARMNNYSMKGISFTAIPEMNPLRFYIFGNKNEKTKLIINKINKGLAEMRDSGIISKLQRKYGLPEN